MEKHTTIISLHRFILFVKHKYSHISTVLLSNPLANVLPVNDYSFQINCFNNSVILAFSHAFMLEHDLFVDFL